MRHLLHAALLSVALSFSPGRAVAAEAATASSFSGLYVTTKALTDGRQSPPDEVYENTKAGGVFIRLVWRAVERSPGAYDWSTLDRELDRALRFGKKIAVSIRAGGSAPDWLVERGVQRSSFVVGKGGRNRTCVTINVPWPWDAKYQDAYIGLMRALAAHLRSRTGAYEAVRIVKVAGIGQSTDEMRLPANRGGPRLRGGEPDPCTPSDAIQTWQRAGYRPSLVVQGWKRMAEGVAAFPEKLIAQAVLDRNDFPPISEDGAIGERSTVKDEIVRSGIAEFPGRFAVNWNGLTAEGRISQEVLKAGRRGAVIGWQTNAFDGHEGAACNAVRFQNHTPCDAQGYAAILQRGIDEGARYIEIWPSDALDFPEAVAQAEAQLSRR